MKDLQRRLQAIEQQARPTLGKKLFVRYLGDPCQDDRYMEGDRVVCLEEIEAAQLEGWECQMLTVEYVDDWKSGE